VIAAVSSATPSFTLPVTTTAPIFSAVQLRVSVSTTGCNEASASCPDTFSEATSFTYTPSSFTDSANCNSRASSSGPAPAPSTSALSVEISSANCAEPVRRTSPTFSSTLLSVSLALPSRSASQFVWLVLPVSVPRRRTCSELA